MYISTICWGSSQRDWWYGICVSRVSHYWKLPVLSISLGNVARGDRFSGSPLVQYLSNMYTHSQLIQYLLQSWSKRFVSRKPSSKNSHYCVSLLNDSIRTFSCAEQSYQTFCSPLYGGAFHGILSISCYSTCQWCSKNSQRTKCCVAKIELYVLPHNSSPFHWSASRNALGNCSAILDGGLITPAWNW